MHVTTKDSVQNEDQAKALGLNVGTHILNFTIEGDGAVALASDKAEFEAKVIQVQRTTSGGIQGQLAIWVKEPAVVAAPPTDPKDLAVAYFVAKGFTTADATAQVDRFGAARVLAQASKEDAEKQADLDKELAALVAKPNTETPPASPAVN